MSNEEIISPWYKQPWFWFLLIFPGAAIIWCIAMITVAVTIDGSMVTDDYSKQGRGIAMDVARDKTARSMGLQASMGFDARSADLTMDADNGRSEFPYLVLNLLHQLPGPAAGRSAKVNRLLATAQIIERLPGGKKHLPGLLKLQGRPTGRCGG